MLFAGPHLPPQVIFSAVKPENLSPSQEAAISAAAMPAGSPHSRASWAQSASTRVRKVTLTELARSLAWLASTSADAGADWPPVLMRSADGTCLFVNGRTTSNDAGRCVSLPVPQKLR